MGDDLFSLSSYRTWQDPVLWTLPPFGAPPSLLVSLWLQPRLKILGGKEPGMGRDDGSSSLVPAPGMKQKLSTTTHSTPSHVDLSSSPHQRGEFYTSFSNSVSTDKDHPLFWPIFRSKPPPPHPIFIIPASPLVRFPSKFNSLDLAQVKASYILFLNLSESESHSVVFSSATSWTLVFQAPLAMGFSR